MKKVTALISIILIIAGSLCVSADAAPTTLDPIISTVHDDGNPSTLTSSSAQGIISRGSAGYTRQKIEVFDLEKLKTPEGYVLDQAVYSVYCITNLSLFPPLSAYMSLKRTALILKTQCSQWKICPKEAGLLRHLRCRGA